MALINCPECGRENVSDSALACPNCGFGIREYFSKTETKGIENVSEADSAQTTGIKTDASEPSNSNAVSPNELGTKTADATKKSTSSKQQSISERQSFGKPVRCANCGAFYPSAYDKCPTCGHYINSPVNPNHSNTTTKNNNKSDRPHFSKGYVIGIIIGIAVALLGATGFIYNDYDRTKSMSHGNGDPRVQGIILILFGVVIIGITLGLFIKKISRYNLRQNNPELYNRIVAEETRRGQERYKAQQQAEQIRLSKLPECPICKSKNNVRRISSLDRGVSVAMVGLASSKIGKQYECTRCRHKF